MLNNLLNTLAFGSVIKQDGKPYSVIMRLTDRLFVVIESGTKLPAPLMVAQVDIDISQPKAPEQTDQTQQATEVVVPQGSGPVVVPGAAKSSTGQGSGPIPKKPGR